MKIVSREMPAYVWISNINVKVKILQVRKLIKYKDIKMYMLQHASYEYAAGYS